METNSHKIKATNSANNYRKCNYSNFTLLVNELIKGWGLQNLFLLISIFFIIPRYGNQGDQIFYQQNYRINSHKIKSIESINN